MEDEPGDWRPQKRPPPPVRKGETEQEKGVAAAQRCSPHPLAAAAAALALAPGELRLASWRASAAPADERTAAAAQSRGTRRRPRPAAPVPAAAGGAGGKSRRRQRDPVTEERKAPGGAYRSRRHVEGSRVAAWWHGRGTKQSGSTSAAHSEACASDSRLELRKCPVNLTTTTLRPSARNTSGSGSTVRRQHHNAIY